MTRKSGIVFGGLWLALFLQFQKQDTPRHLWLAPLAQRPPPINARTPPEDPSTIFGVDHGTLHAFFLAASNQWACIQCSTAAGQPCLTLQLLTGRAIETPHSSSPFVPSSRSPRSCTNVCARLACCHARLVATRTHESPRDGLAVKNHGKRTTVIR